MPTTPQFPRSKLQPATRSILFYKGMSDHADKFIAKSPAIDYAENLFPEKEGSYSKRNGFTEVPSSNTIGGTEPILLHSIGDRLFTITEDKAYVFSDGGWQEIGSSGSFPIGNSDFLCQGKPVAGARDYSACIVREESVPDELGAPIAYMIACSVKLYEQNYVLIQSFALDGQLISEIKVDQAWDPVVVNHRDSDGAFVFYVKGSDIVRCLVLPKSNFISVEHLVAQDISAEGRYTLSAEHSIPETIKTENHVRMGLCGEVVARRNAPYQLDFNESGGSLFYRNLSGNLIFTSLDSSGLSSGDIPIFTPMVDINNDTYTCAQPLGVIYEPEGSLFMWAFRDWVTDPTGCTVFFRYHSITGGTHYAQSLPDIQGLISHGSFCRQSGTVYLHFAYHAVFGDVVLPGGEGDYETAKAFDARATNIYANSELRYGRISIATGDYDIFGLPSHRLVSTLVDIDGVAHGVVQQWAIFHPYPWGNLNEPRPTISVLPQTKPVSSVLVRLDQGIVSPMGLFGPGQSRFTDPSADESTCRLSRLFFDTSDDKFFYLNREILTSEDVAVLSAWRDTDGQQSVVPLAPSEARGVFCTRGPASREGIISAHIGNAILINSSIPASISKSLVSELAVLERPEILHVEPLRQTPEVAYASWEIVFPSTKWRKFQIVVGFSDPSGIYHRSQPSHPLYIENLTADGIPQEELLFHVTTPISVFAGRGDYFVELYGSNIVTDEPQLMGIRQIKAADGGIGSYVQQISVRDKLDLETDSLPHRSSQFIYTAGSNLPANPWPVVKQFLVMPRRLWALSKQFQGTVFYSKLFEENIAPEFTGSFVIPLGEERTLTAIGQLDDKVIVFEKNAIHVIYGEGPDNRGFGQDFAVEFINSGGIGCDSPRSVIQTPVGLIFYHSPRGFYLLDRSRQLHFIGAPVEDLTQDLDIYSATLDSSEAEIRFLVRSNNPFDSDGPDPEAVGVDRPPRPWIGNSLPQDACLCFNYESGVWSLFTNMPGYVSTIHQDRYAMMVMDEDDNWHVWQQSEDSWSDPTGTNRTLFRSHWIELGSQIQDYSRLWKITFLGRYLSSLKGTGDNVYEAGDIVVRIYYDYEKDFSQEKRFYFQDFGYNPFNSPPKRTERFQFNIEPNRGRCQAIKIEVEEVPSIDRGEGLNYSLGRGFQIVSADVRVGLSPPETTRLLSYEVRK